MKKRILSLVLTGALCLSTAAPALAAGLDNFGKVNTYTAGQFTDIPADAWFTPNVQAAYELDLMTGSSATTFNPNGNLTIAEALVLACRLHSTYVGDGETFAANGGIWYQPYVDYAVKNGIIAANAYTDYTATATRAQFAAILAAALPDEALPAINSVTSLPDLDANAAYAAAVLKLYNAGILTGSDTAGSFKPTSTIQRSEVATIVTRMADKSLRKTFTLSAAPSTPNVPASTKKFDGPITLDDLQGVWYAESYNYGALTMKSELIFNGDNLTLIRYHADSERYDAWKGTVTVHSEMLASDPNVCHMVLEMSDYLYVSVINGNGRVDEGVECPSLNYDSNIMLEEDCFKQGSSTFKRADNTQIKQMLEAAGSVDLDAVGKEPLPDLSQEAYEFLADYIQTEGRKVTFGDFNGQYALMLNWGNLYGTNDNWDYYAYYDPASGNITFHCDCFLTSDNGDIDSTDLDLLLTPELTPPYLFTLSSYNAVSEKSAIAYLDPDSFGPTTEALEFASYEGYTLSEGLTFFADNDLDYDQKNSANVLRVLLRALNEEVLKPNGYRLTDLGFTNF